MYKRLTPFPTFTVFFLLVFTLPALAVPVEWSFSGVSRVDGGTVSGSFIYDADTNIYSSIAITTTGGTSTLPGASYSGYDPDPAASDAEGVIFLLTQGAPDVSGQNALFLSFPALTNAGGVITILGVAEVACGNSDCTSASNAQSVFGTITGTVVAGGPPSGSAQLIPTMPLYALIVMALGLLLLAKRFIRKDPSH